MVEEAQLAAVETLGDPGDWLTGEQRIAVWREVRDSNTNELDRARRAAVSPTAVDGTHPASAALEAAAVEVVQRVASDSGRLTRRWADQHIAELGEETYTELVGVTAIVTVIDRFHRAMGRPEVPLPSPVDGPPQRVRPSGVGDVGAWVSQTTGETRANVTRSLSLVPQTNQLWRTLVDSHYSRGPEFMDLSWDRPLSRPQAELVAARTTTLNECFY